MTIKDDAATSVIKSVAVRYTSYSDDYINVLDGYENFTRTNASATVEVTDWYSDLVRIGDSYSTR